MAKKVLKTSEEGRVCQFPKCGQHLSIYNHEQFCRMHLEKMSEASKPKPHRFNSY